MASRYRALLLTSLIFVLPGCPKTDLQGGGSGRGALRDSPQAVNRLKGELEQVRKNAADRIASLMERIENLENQVTVLRSGVPGSPAREGEQGQPPGPAGEPSEISPVGLPRSDAQASSPGFSADEAKFPATSDNAPAQRQESRLVPPPRASGPENEYSRAVQVLREERSFARARNLLSAFIAKYPTHELSDDAQYWIGQSYFEEKNFERAILAFNKVQVDYANGDKAPEALLLEAISFLNLGDRASARELLSRVMSKYPDSGAALKARERLKSL